MINNRFRLSMRVKRLFVCTRLDSNRLVGDERLKKHVQSNANKSRNAIFARNGFAGRFLSQEFPVGFMLMKSNYNALEAN